MCILDVDWSEKKRGPLRIISGTALTTGCLRAAMNEAPLGGSIPPSRILNVEVGLIMRRLAKLHVGQNVNCVGLNGRKTPSKWRELKITAKAAVKRVFEKCVWCAISNQT